MKQGIFNFDLWNAVLLMLSANEFVYANDIIDYCQKNNIQVGSEKTTAQIHVNYYFSKMIKNMYVKRQKISGRKGFGYSITDNGKLYFENIKKNNGKLV